MKGLRRLESRVSESQTATYDFYVKARVDKETKTKAKAALTSMGLSVYDAIRILLLMIALRQCFSLEYKSFRQKKQTEIAEIEPDRDCTIDNVKNLWLYKVIKINFTKRFSKNYKRIKKK